MKEILVSGDVTKDFNRLGVIVRQTYNGEDYGICEVTEDEFKILCDEPDIENTWEDCGWRYCEGSNQGIPDATILVNNKPLTCWLKNDYNDDIEEDDEEPYIPEYNNLLEYLCDEMGCSAFRNVCALTKNLAKYNNITMAELFQKYQ